MAHVKNPLRGSREIFSGGGYVDYHEWVAPISRQTYTIIRELGYPIHVVQDGILGKSFPAWIQAEFDRVGTGEPLPFVHQYEGRHLGLEECADSYIAEGGERMQYVKLSLEEGEHFHNWEHCLHQFWGRIRAHYRDAKMKIRPDQDLINGFSTLAAKKWNWHGGFQISEPFHVGTPGIIFDWNDSWRDVKNACKEIGVNLPE